MFPVTIRYVTGYCDLYRTCATYTLICRRTAHFRSTYKQHSRLVADAIQNKAETQNRKTTILNKRRKRCNKRVGNIDNPKYIVNKQIVLNREAILQNNPVIVEMAMIYYSLRRVFRIFCQIIFGPVS